MRIKVFETKNDSEWGYGEVYEIHTLIKEHYSAPEWLKPENLNDLHLPCFVVYSHDDCNSESIIGVSFFKPINNYLVRTRTTVVHSDFRGQGVGTKLNQRMEREFKKRGFGKISCNIYTDNQPSLKLKMNRGYIIEGLLKDHDGPGMDEYVLAKFL